MMMASSIGQLTAPLSAASQAADANAIFHTIIDAPKPTYGKLKGPEASAEGDIVFQNVNFVYPKRPDVKILENLSLTFPAGKVTAIVGPSGSGKSTIVGILERWYEFNGDLQANQLVSLTLDTRHYLHRLIRYRLSGSETVSSAAAAASSARSTPAGGATRSVLSSRTTPSSTPPSSRTSSTALSAPSSSSRTSPSRLSSSSRPARTPSLTSSSPACPRATRPRSVTPASSCQVVNANALPSPAPSSSSPRSSSSTRPPPPSM